MKSTDLSCLCNLQFSPETFSGDGTRQPEGPWQGVVMWRLPSLLKWVGPRSPEGAAKQSCYHLGLSCHSVGSSRNVGGLRRQRDLEGGWSLSLGLESFSLQVCNQEEQRFLLETTPGLAWYPQMGVLNKLTKPTAQAAQGCSKWKRLLAKRTRCQIFCGWYSE